MSRPDRRWRPADADRERYAAAISQAFADGRIDAADMESRTALVYEATSIADLDALVEDMPAPAPAAPPNRPAPVRTRKVAGAAAAALIGAMAVVLILGAVLLSAVRDDASSAPDPAPAAPPAVAEEPPPDEVADPPPVADEDLPPIASVKLPMLELEGLQQLWAAAADMEPSDISLFSDRATLEVRSNSAQRALDRVDYTGGLVLPREPYRELGDHEPDGEVFFAWTDVTPEAVVAAIAGMPAALGVDTVTVSHISIGHYQDGEVTISVYPEGDIGSTYVRWDATGQQVIRVY